MSNCLNFPQQKTGSYKIVCCSSTQSTICRESPTHPLRHFVGIAVLKRKPTALWLCMRYKGKLVFLSVCLRILRFWLGDNLEQKLGEAFSPPQFTVRESEVSERIFFSFFFFCVCVCVCVCARKHWQMESPHPPPPLLFSFFMVLQLESPPLIGMGLACLSHPTFFWYFLWTLS